MKGLFQCPPRATPWVILWIQACRPVRAKALKYLMIYKAFALTGRLADCYYTQGVALG